MASRKDLTDAEILRFLRFGVTESAAATFTQQTLDTQLSIDRGMLWLIHFIEVMGLTLSNVDDPAQAASETISVQITRESQAGLVNYNDPDLIELITLEKDRCATIGTDTGPVILHQIEPLIYYYRPAIAYAAQNIHVSVISSSAGARTVYGRIGYTLRRVSDKFFFRVAQALIS